MDSPLEPSRLRAARRRLVWRARLLPITLLQLLILVLVPLALGRPTAHAQSREPWILDSYEVIHTEDVFDEVETRRQIVPAGSPPVFVWGGSRTFTDYPFGTLAATGTLTVDLPDDIVPGQTFTVGGGATGVVSTPGRQGLHAAVLAAFSECYLPKVCRGALKNQYIDDVAGKSIDLAAPLASITATLPVDPVDWPPNYVVMFRGGIGTSTPGDPYWRVRIYAYYKRPEVAVTPVPSYVLEVDADTTRLPPSGTRPSEAVLTATMVDGSGRPVSGEALRFALEPPDMGRLTTASGVTDAAGEVRIGYQAPDVAGLLGRDTAVVVVTNAARGLERRLIMRVERYRLAITVDPAEIPVEPVWRAIRVTVEVRDFDGRPVVGDIVQLRVDPPDMGTFIGATMAGNKAPTDAAGRVEAFFEPLPPSRLNGRDRATIYATNLTHGGEEGAGVRFLGLKVIRTWPREDARDIELAVEDSIDLEFDRAIDPATVNDRTVKVETLWHGNLGGTASGLASSARVQSFTDPIPDVGLTVKVRVEAGEDGVKGRDGSLLLAPFEFRFHTMPKFDPKIIVSQVVDNPRDRLFGVISLALKPFILRVDAGISEDSELDYEQVSVRLKIPRRSEDLTLDHRYYPGRWPPKVPGAAAKKGNTANFVVRPPFGRGGYNFEAELKPIHAVPEKIVPVPAVTANVNSWSEVGSARKMGMMAIPIINDKIQGFDWRVSRGQQESWLLGLSEPAANYLPLTRIDLRLGFLADTTCIDPDKCKYRDHPYTEFLYWAQNVGRAGFMTRVFGWRYVVALVPPGWFDRFADHPDVAANPQMYHGAVDSGVWAYKAGIRSGREESGFPIAIMEVGTSSEALVHVLGDIEGLPDSTADRDSLRGYDLLNDQLIYADPDRWYGAYRSIMNLSVGFGTTWPTVADYEHFLGLWSERSCVGPPPCPPRLSQVSESGADDGAGPAGAQAVDQADAVPLVVVSGTIFRSSGGQETGLIDPLVAAEPDIPSLSANGQGDYAIELRDRSELLARYPFAPAFGPVGDGMLAGILATIPADPAATVITVVHGTVTVARRTRSANPPEVRFDRPEADVTHRGAIDVAWRGQDANDDTLTYSLLYSGDAGATWAPLLIDSAETTLRLDTDQLPSGQDSRLRVVASDGFDSAAATIAFGLDNPLTVLAEYPADGSRGVSERVTVLVRLRDQLDAASIDGDGLVLIDGSGARVAGTVGYEPANSTVVFTPTLELDPATAFEARLAGSVRTLYGRTLGADHTWHFRTRGPTLYLPLAFRNTGAPYQAATPTTIRTPGPVPSLAATQTRTPDAARTATPSSSAVASATPSRTATPGTIPEGSATPTATPDIVATAVAATLTAMRPSPSATSAATPTPSATIAAGPGDITADDATTTGANAELARMAFVPGEAITLWVRVVNRGAATMSAQFDYSVRDDAGAVVAALAWVGNVDVPPGTNWFKLERAVPATVQPGPHTFVGRVSVAGTTTDASAELLFGTSLLMADDFSNPSSGWQAGQDASGQYGYAGGEYRFLFTAADSWRWSSPPTSPSVTDMAVEADVRMPGTAAGNVALVFGLNANGTDFHLYEITHDGRYAIYRRLAGAWETIIPLRASTALRTGGATNHLMVARLSGLTYLYANSELVSMVTDLDVPAGRTGIYASNGAAGFEGRFDNVRVYGLR